MGAPHQQKLLIGGESRTPVHRQSRVREGPGRRRLAGLDSSSRGAPDEGRSCRNAVLVREKVGIQIPPPHRVVHHLARELQSTSAAGSADGGLAGDGRPRQSSAVSRAGQAQRIGRRGGHCAETTAPAPPPLVGVDAGGPSGYPGRWRQLPLGPAGAWQPAPPLRRGAVPDRRRAGGGGDRHSPVRTART